MVCLVLPVHDIDSRGETLSICELATTGAFLNFASNFLARGITVITKVFSRSNSLSTKVRMMPRPAACEKKLEYVQRTNGGSTGVPSSRLYLTKLPTHPFDLKHRDPSS
uniref:Uncharacterized protein n=1 Tax=Tetraselmis sp. GSL018 TaxID=582737 RepID=A0A061R6V6_9CHLO